MAESSRDSRTWPRRSADARGIAHHLIDRHGSAEAALASPIMRHRQDGLVAMHLRNLETRGEAR